MANISFQTSINSSKPWGVRGDFLDGNYNHMYPLTLLAKAGDSVAVEVGKFAWDNGDGTCSAVGTGKPTGLVHRTIIYPISDITTGASMEVPANYPCGIADKCAMLIEVSDTPTVGNYIFVNNTTGAITNAANGAIVSGATQTDYKIITLCDNEAAEGMLVGVNFEPAPAVAVDLSGYLTTEAAAETYQGKLTAGTGIAISDENVISTTNE